jgi:hypothetical protein
MAECLGSKLALFLNGKEVASVSDGAITIGLIGIYARNQDAASTELVFKNPCRHGPVAPSTPPSTPEWHFTTTHFW